METDQDDYDPFTYVPLAKKRRRSGTKTQKKIHSTISAQPGPSSTTECSTQQKNLVPKTKKSRSFRSLLKSEPLKPLEKKSMEEEQPLHCCYCQIPFNLLSRPVSPEMHVAACLEHSFDNVPPCPYGVDCDIGLPNHYLRYNHAFLAMHRSKSDEGNQKQVSDDRTTIDEKIQNEDNNNPIKVTADRDDENMTLKISIDQERRLKRLSLKIPINDGPNEASTGPAIQVQGSFSENLTRVSREEAKKQFGKIFGQAKKLDDKKKLYEKTKKQGYQGPSNSNSEGEVAKRTCPFYKKIPGTSFTVDAFCYGSVPGITKYFLSHFHYDHFRGLAKSFKHIIVCSEITARLILLKIKVDKSRIRALPLNESVLVDQVEVTLLEANHCPGAVMFLFKLLGGKTILHCGDFRAHPDMEEYPALWNNAIDTVYLDTTYCKPEYDFPSQSDVISKTCDLVKEHLEKFPNSLICVGSYTIGKERIFTALAEEIDSKLWAGTEKCRILKTLLDPVIEKRLVAVSQKARIHVMEMRRLHDRRDLLQYLEILGGKFDHILTVSPTGWTHNAGATPEVSLMNLKVATNGKVSSLKVPYSEHSSFSELKRFVQFLKLKSADEVIPTVNVGSPQARNAMKKLFHDWVHNKEGARLTTHIDKFLIK